jgi:hypothetical protein
VLYMQGDLAEGYYGGQKHVQGDRVLPVTSLPAALSPTPASRWELSMGRSITRPHQFYLFQQPQEASDRESPCRGAARRTASSIVGDRIANSLHSSCMADTMLFSVGFPAQGAPVARFGDAIGVRMCGYHSWAAQGHLFLRPYQANNPPLAPALCHTPRWFSHL